jgi:GTP cyclohydrolase I
VKLPKKRTPSDDFLSFFKGLNIPQQEFADGALDLKSTPKRIVKMYREELLAGYIDGAEQALIDSFTCFPSDGNDAMVFIGPIDYTSLCAHHLLPFTGAAYVAYIPEEKVVGASKIPRVVTHYSRMLQIQERLTRQVVDFVMEHASPRLVVALFEGAHQCMRCRGVKQANTQMITTAIRPDHGRTLPKAIDEFYQQLQFAKGNQR